MSLRKKQSVKRLKAALNKNYESKANTIQAGPLGSNQIYAAGQVYNASLDGVTEVVNVGRPAAAQYVARRSGGTTVVAAGGGSGSGGGVTGDYLRLDGSTIMLGDLNMGSSDIINVGTVDGVDVSAFKATYDAHVLDADAHHDQVHSITGSDHTITSAKWGIVGATAVNTIGILTPSAAPGAAEAILKSTSSGGLTLPLMTATTSVTTPLIASTGDLKLDPVGGDVWIDGNVGVGIATPESLLHVQTTTAATNFLILEGDRNVGDTEIGILFKDRSAVSSGQEAARIFSQRQGASADFDLVFHAGDATLSGLSTELLRLDGGDQRVGIKQSSPSYDLDVSGDARTTGTVYANTALQAPLINTATGDLTLAPADDIMLDPTSNLVKSTSGVSLQADNYASQVSGWRITYDGQADFRYIYTDELHAKAFIADLEQALAGGQIIAKSVTILYSDFTAPAAGGTASLTVRDLPSATGMAVFVDGDYIRIREFSRSGGSLSIADCWGTVVLDTSYGTSGFDSATKTQRYTFTRSTSPNAGAMTTGNVVEADAIILDYGTSGNGFYEVNAIDGLYGANSPYSQIVTWSGHPRNQTVQARLGNLYGIWSVTGEYGLYAGEGVTDDDSYLRISNNAVRLNNVPLQLYNSGTQTVNIDATGTDIWVGVDDTDKRLSWNGTTLAIEGDIVITGGSGIASLSDAGSLATADDLDDVSDGATYKRTNANEKTGAGRAYTAINSSNNLVTSVIPATAVTPSGAGLYLGSNYMGYYADSAWKTYIADTGDFVFAGNAAGNYIQWDASANKLQGVGSTVEQWYADATDGKLYAGAGATWLDVDGVNILADTTTTHASQSNAKAVTFERDNGTLVGRLTSYYISGTTTYGLDLYARSPNQEATFATFGSEQAGTTYAGGSAGAPRVVAYNASGGGDELRLYSSGTIKLFNTASASADVTLSSGTLTTGALNSGALGVTGNITVSGTVDGVDIAAFKTAYDSHTHAYLPLSGGTLTGTLTGRDVVPSTGDTYDLGSDSAYYDAAYIRNLHIDTIVGTPSYSHTHAASDITSGTLDDARLPGTQTGKTFTSSIKLDADASSTYNYLRWDTDTSNNKRWDLIGFAHDYGTSSLQNDMALQWFDGSSGYNVFIVDNATQVVNFLQTPTVGGTAVSLVGHTHAASAITSGTFDLARIPATLTGKTAQYVSSTVVAGSGIGVSGSLSSGNVTVSHSDTSSQASVNNSGSTFIQDVTLDTYGHVTALVSVDAATALSGTFVPVTRTITAGSGLTGGGDLSANRTISHDDTSSQASVDNSGTTIIQDVTLDGFGHVTALGSVDISTALDALYVNVTGDTMTGALTVPQILNTVISQPSQSDRDMSMIGYFDRNELVYANYTGTVTYSITGASTSIVNNDALVDGTGNYTDIRGTDNTTTQIRITVDRGSNVDTFGHAFWQPFLAYRLDTGASFTWYNNVVVEVSADGSTWYKPSGALWETSDFDGDKTSAGLWIGGYGQPVVPGNVWRYARFTLTSRQENSSYAFKDRVWIAAVGVRHVSAQFSKKLLDRAGDTMFGDFAIQTGGVNVFDVDVSAALTTVSGDLDVTDDLTVETNATVDGTMTVITSLTVADNTNADTILGRAKIGYAAGTDTATFSHYDHNSSTAFGLSQYNSGATMLNAASGQYVDIGVNATSTLTINADRVLPRGNMQVGLGDYNRKFSDLHAFELIVENLVAQDVMATIGGRIVVAPTTYLSADVALAGANTFFAEHNNLSSGDFAYMAAFIDGSAQVEYVRLHSNAVGSGPYEYRIERQAQASNTTTLLNAMTNVATTMDTVANNLSNGDYVQLADYGNFKLETVRVTSSASVISGGYRYSVTRNATSMAAGAQAWSSGQGVKIIAKLWYEGNAIVSTGDAVGEGYIELTSTETLLSQFGPTISITSRTDADVWNGLTEVVALGNLRSRVDYGGNEDYGLAIGNDTSLTPTTGFSGITADSTDGLRLFNTDIKLYNSGTQTVNIDNTGTDVWFGTSSSNKALVWNGSSLALRSNNADTITLSASGNASIAGILNVGTSGGIYQGTGTFASPTTGLKIWNDGGAGRIAGYNSSTIQWYAASDGKLYAGAGAVQVDQGGVKLFESTTNITRIGNLNGLVDYATNVQGVAIGNNLLLTPTTGFKGIAIDNSNGVRLFSVDIGSYSGSTQKVSITSAGNMKLGTNTASAATTSFDFNVSSGALRVGFETSSKANLQFDGSNLNLRTNTSTVAQLTSAGAMTIGQPGSNRPSLHYDGTNLHLRTTVSSTTTNVITLESTGAAYFAGPISLGASGGIYQGSSGSFASPGTGLKIWRDSNVGRIAGYNSGTVQWYAATDGKFYAGGGNTMIDANGIHISNPGTGRGIRLYNTDTYTDTNKVGELWALADLTPRVYLAAGKSVAAGDSSNDGGILSLTGYSTLGDVSLILDGDNGVARFTADVDLNGNDITDIGTIGESWTAVTFGAGWTNLAGYQVCQYKVVGDLVFLRGMAARTSGTGTTILTLPSGARPADDEIFAAYTSTGIGAVSVAPGGAVVHLAGSTTWVSLSGIVMSINS